MRLWTWQTPDTSLIKDKLAPRRYSPFYSDTDFPNIKNAYEKLFIKFGDQIIWYYTDAGEGSVQWPGRLQWEVEVPERDILVLVHGSVWNKIIGQGHFAPPQRLREEWCRQANSKTRNSKDSRALFEQYHHLYCQKEPLEQLWKRLWVVDEVGEDIWALLKHPIDKSYVKNPSTKL